MLHDAEDVVHPLELTLFDRLIERAGVIQLPVLPLVDPASRWISGHYCDEFAESHAKELVVREAVGAAIPLAGVGCAISRQSLSQLAGLHGGRPFAGTSMTEDYEMGLRLGALGVRTMFVRLPALPGSRAVVSSRGHFPASLDDAVRQKARWIGGIAFAGWDRLGWRGGLGERWMRMRDRRGPLAALVIFAGYLAAFLWSQMWLADVLGAPRPAAPSPALCRLADHQRLAARLAGLDAGRLHHLGLRPGPGPQRHTAAGGRQSDRLARRPARLLRSRHRRPAPVGQDPPHLPDRAAPRMSAAIRFLGIALVAWVGLRSASLGLVPGAEALAVHPRFHPGAGNRL